VAKTRRRSTPARKTSKSRTSSRAAATSRSPSKPRGVKVVRMKPLYQELGRTIAQLEKLGPSERVKFAIERLNQCRAEFADICGPTMDVPGGLPIP
jgi:hypothetical protein